MNKQFRYFVIFKTLFFSLPLFAQSVPPAATIVQQSGQNQWRENLTANWADTQLEQTLNKGNHVKTGQQSKLALLFRDESQLRLNQNSLLIIRDVLDERGNSTRFRLNSGRAWVKSKNIPDKLIMETPSAVAAIRGTDWDIQVDNNGDSTITVLHGQVSFSNEFGEVIVNANEQAIAKIGQAPFKLIVANPKDRIQWVSEYQINPQKFLSIEGAKENASLDLLQTYQNLTLEEYSRLVKTLQDSPFRTALLADLLLYSGEMDNAIALLESNPNNQTIAQLQVLTGQAKLMKGHAQSIDNQKNLPVISIHNAKVAYFNGKGDEAIALYQQVLSQQPNNIEALYGLGRIYTELENIDLALVNLNGAILAKPRDPRAYGEKATLHAFYDQFSAAENALDQAEKLGFNQAILLTGRGIIALKQGRLDEAKTFLLKAGVIEPQLARIQVFLAMVYYQLGRFELAKQTLEYAAELDINDPLPYFMLSHIFRETYQPSEALSASLDGIERLSNLKSLNQLANNLAGNTNLGAALASYGLNDWALKLAVDSYHPFLANNQLFFSHRVNNDRFVQQSELFKGILNDPLVFGGSNTFTDLAEQPNIHGTLRFQRLDIDTDGFNTTTHSPSLIINGINKKIVPAALFLEQIGNNIQRETQNNIITGNSQSSPEFTRIGLGVELTPKLSAFYYSNSGGGVSRNQDLVQGDNFSTPSDVTTVNDLSDKYYGVKYQIAPNHDINFTYFDIDDFNEQNASIETNIQTETDDFSFISNSNVINRFIQNRSVKTTQFNWRILTDNHHFFDVGISRDKNDSIFLLNTQTQISSITTFQGEVLNEINTDTVSNNNTFDEKDIKQGYLHWQSNRNKQWYTDLFLNYYDISSDLNTINDISPLLSQSESLNDSQFSFGFGVKYSFNDHWLIRQSYRDWTNSGSVVTSGPTLLAGIPFSTRFSLTGTEIKRTALQLEYQNSRTYVQFSADIQNIDNTNFSDSFVNNTTDLLSENIRQLSAVNNDISTLFESDSRFFADPRFNLVKGRAQIYSISASRYLTSRISGNVSYRYFETEQRDLDENNQAINRRFFTNQARSIFRFTSNYTAPFTANIFVNGSYFQYPDSETDLSDGWIWNIGWRQEFYKKRILVSVQRLIQQVDKSNSWNINTEIRF